MGRILGLLRRHLIPLVLFVLLDVLLTRNYFNASAIPTGTDLFPWLTRIKVDSTNLGALYTWDSTTGGGPRLLGSVDIFLMAANLFFNNPSLIVKLLIFGTLALAEFSAYYSALYLTTNRIASSVSGLLFVLSPFFLATLSLGQLHVLLPFALLPLLIPLYSKTMRTQGIREMLLLSGFCSLIVFVGRLDIVKFVGLSLVSLIFVDLISNPISTWPRYVARLAKFSVVLIGTLAFVFLSDATLFVSGATPSFVQGLKQYETPSVFIGDTPDLFRAILGLYQGGYYSTLWGITLDRHPYLPQQIFFLVMSIVPVVAFLSVLLDKRKTTYALAFQAVLSSFMAKGFNPPLGTITYWLYYSVPFGYAIVRGALLWIGVTTLSYSLLAALTVNALLRRLRTRSSSIGPRTVTIATVDNYERKSCRNLRSLRSYFLPATFLILLALGPELGTAYSLSSGLQVWTVPPNVSGAYDWLSSQTGDFRVASFPWQQSYMFVPVNGSTSGWWQGDVGNTLGFALHGKNMWSQSYFSSDAGYDLQSYFTDLILNNATRDLPKMLGIYGVKYFIDNGYTATALGSPLTLLDQSSMNYESRFLARQQGLSLVYSNGGARVFENKYWTPQIFIPEGNLLVVGGKDTLASLAQLQGFDFRQWTIFFAGQVARTGGSIGLQSLISRSDFVVFKDSTLTDLDFLLATDKGVWLDPSSTILGKPSTFSGTWALNPLYSQQGLFTLRPSLASADGNASLEIPFKAAEFGQRDVWVRLAFGPERGTLSLRINGQTVGNVTPVSSQSDVRWVRIGQANLTSTGNAIELRNTQSFFGRANDIDGVVIIPPKEMGQVSDSLFNTLTFKKPRLIFLYGQRSGSDWLSDFSSMGKLMGAIPLLNGDLSQSWSTTDPNHVAISSGQIPPLSSQMPPSAQVSLLPNRTTYAIIERTNGIDLHDYDNLAIDVKGLGTGDDIGVSFLFGNTYSNEATFNFPDTSRDWRIVSFSLARPSAQQGDVDWSKVWKVQVASGSKQSQGNLSLDLFATSQANKTVDLNLPTDGRYSFAPQSGNTSYFLNVDGNQLLSSSQLSMQRGAHLVTIPYRSLVSGGLAIYSLQNEETSPSLDEAFASVIPQATVLSYKAVSPTEYAIRVNASGPFTIVTSSNYHPLWRAILANRSFAPLIAYGSMLSFYVPAKGVLDLTLKFTPQNYIVATGFISISTLALLWGVVIYRSRRRQSPRLRSSVCTTKLPVLEKAL